MLKENATILNIKHEVLYHVAKLAFAGKLEEKKEELPYTIIPGPHAQFRCCVYREREIIRQRIRLAEGQNPVGTNASKNVVQVIPSACEGCPITRFVVTDNCQKCMSKRCQQACNFDAITMLRDRAHIDPQKCRECGKCSKACPYNAIADLMRPCKRTCPVDAISMDENGLVVIDDEKCIQCGSCTKDCPFGALADRSSLVDVIGEIRAQKKVYAMAAPAGEGMFGANVSMGVLAAAIRQLGFTDLFEVALGADFVADSEAKEWAEAYKEGKKMTTSCCPAFVNMIQKHFPELTDHVSTTVSPMAATARIIKAMEPDAVCVFIGPCISKKSEIIDARPGENADYVLTFEELSCMFDAQGIELGSFGENLQQGSIYGKKFANAGGVTEAVLEALKEQEENTDIKVEGCSGARECKKALSLLKFGKLQADFIEGMACEGGCVNGPGTLKLAPMLARDRNMLLSRADGREIRAAVEKYKEWNVEMHRRHS